MAFCASCGTQLDGASCGQCGNASAQSGSSQKETNVELVLLQRYADEIQILGEQLADADPQRAKALQKDLGRKIDIYTKQLQVFKNKFPDSVESRIYESSLYGFLAAAKCGSVGFVKRAAAKHNSLALALIAKQQEKNNAREALTLLDKAISIYDDGRSRFMKATIYYALKQKNTALTELSYVIQHAEQQSAIYLQARQLKDEIENPPKTGMCFIATATYGSAFAPEVVLLSRFRDETLLKSSFGVSLVQFYYRISPNLAAIIRRSKWLRSLTRVFLVGPLLHLVKSFVSDEPR